MNVSMTLRTASFIFSTTYGSTSTTFGSTSTWSTTKRHRQQGRNCWESEGQFWFPSTIPLLSPKSFLLFIPKHYGNKSGTNFAHVQIFMNNSVFSVTTPNPNCMLVAFIDTTVFIQIIANFLKQLRRSDVPLTATSLIISHLLFTVLEPLVPTLNKSSAHTS